MKKKCFIIVFLVLTLFLNACGAIPVMDTIDPAAFLTDQVESTDNAYQWKELPWYTTRKEAMKKLEDHTWFLNQGQMITYAQDAALTDGTPIKAKLSLGFTDETEEGELAIVRWVFLMEDDDEQTVRQLYQAFCNQLDPWMDNGTNVQESISEQYTTIRKASGSYIDMRWDTNSRSPIVINSEYPDDLWPQYACMTVELWWPVDRAALIQSGTMPTRP